MKHVSIRAKDSLWPRLLAALALLAMLVVGRYTYRDYGITVDETVERNTSSSTISMLSRRFWEKTWRLADSRWKPIKTVLWCALQLPTVVVEHLTGFTMPRAIIS